MIINNTLSKTSNVLCERWKPKTTSALASGTNQKTEDFEERENWVLVCGGKIRCGLLCFPILNLHLFYVLPILIASIKYSNLFRVHQLI